MYAEETHQDPSAVKQEEEIARPSLQSIESAGVEAVSGSEEADVEDIAQDAKVSSISLTGRDAHLFEIADINGSAATLQLKDSAHVITKYKYEVKLAYVIETGSAAYTIESAPVGIKLAQGKVKAAAAGANTFSAAVSEGKSLNFTVTNSMGEQVEISDVKLVNFSKDFAYDFETGVLKHQLNGETARGKSYTLKFELYLADRGDNEKPVTVTWKVQIVK